MVTSFTDWESGIYLAHHGIKGQKWGVRRYQNPDGTLTTLGKFRGGHSARKENRLLKKDIRENNRLRKEWTKAKKVATKKAIKDDDYRQSIAKLEAARLSIPKEHVKDWIDSIDARLAGERVADNMMWYKHGGSSYKNAVRQAERGEKIAKNVLKKLEKKGLNIEENGRRWQSKLEEESGLSQSGKNFFEGKPAHYTLSLLQSQREIENRRRKRKGG